MRRRLPPLLRAAWYGLNQAFRRRIARLRITPDQFTALRTLTEHEGITQRQLSARMSSDPNTVASLLGRMEKAGLVERRPHASDRRAHSVRLTPEGKRKLGVARRQALELQSKALSALPSGDQERFLEMLERVASACQRLNERKVAAAPRRG